MTKSILISSPGRCGMHWLSRILRKVLGLEQQKTRRWWELIPRQGWCQGAVPLGKLYTTHDPLSYLLPILEEVDFVAMIRDPRDAVVSCAHYWRARLRSGDQESIKRMHSVWGNPDMPLDANFETVLAALKIRVPNTWWWQQYLWFRKVIPHHVVRYEDLHEHPFQTIQQLLVNMARPQPNKAIRAALEQSVFEKVSGGRRIGEEDSAHFYRKGIVGDWRNYFTDEENAAFCQRFATIMNTFEYEPFQYRSREQIDPECVRLVNALNLVPGIRTTESCCGHGRHAYWIWCIADSTKHLPYLGYHLNGRYHHHDWRLRLDGGTQSGKGAKADGSNLDTLWLWVQGPQGVRAYAESEELAAILERRFG